jgi:hypothetical protein
VERLPLSSVLSPLLRRGARKSTPLPARFARAIMPANKNALYATSFIGDPDLGPSLHDKEFVPADHAFDVLGNAGGGFDSDTEFREPLKDSVTEQWIPDDSFGRVIDQGRLGGGNRTLSYSPAPANPARSSPLESDRKIKPPPRRARLLLG